jgi:transcriptional regulator with PAS, ATPase and Fis domain
LKLNKIKLITWKNVHHSEEEMRVSEKAYIIDNDGSTTEQNKNTEGRLAFVSRNPLIFDILSRIKLITNSTASVLISGESGTGKDVLARLIHQSGSGFRKPFIAVNCAALPKDVVENELFGHEKEAFTGAVSKKVGCFELAHGGTLFLDEIVEMNPQTQAKLLRAIENKSFRRLGGREEVLVETRVVAATNRDIQAALKNGQLREDLFYRLSVVEICIPPLRERREDIPILVDHFFDLLTDKYQKINMRFSPDAMEMLMNYKWPGNVRELRNLIERMMLVCPYEIITPEFLPEKIAGARPVSDSMTVPLGISLMESERIIIDRTLESVNYNKSEAARILGISRRTLHSKLKKGN